MYTLLSEYPYATGKIKLKVVPSVPVVFCEDVILNKYMFYKYAKMHILLTVTWEKPFNESIHDATASWSENVRRDGFTACALVAGRHFFGLADTPSVHWVAYQAGVESMKYGMESGVIVMDTWYTGARCQEIKMKVCMLFIPNCVSSQKINNVFSGVCNVCPNASDTLYLCLDTLHLCSDTQKLSKCFNFMPE